MDLELFFEFGSQYSYLAAMLADDAARARGLSIVYRPFLLGPIFAAQGYQQPPFVQFATKGAYVWRDLERLCAELELPWNKPTVFPRKGVLAARIALVAVDEGWGVPFTCRVFQLNFVHDQDTEDEAALRSIVSELGQSPDDVIARAMSAENKARLKTQTERAQALGIFGAPTFVVSGELFWGQDRMRQALDWAERNKAGS
jgi:2-hydroxychromene-2-carboxylate isomerase